MRPTYRKVRPLAEERMQRVVELACRLGFVRGNQLTAIRITRSATGAACAVGPPRSLRFVGEVLMGGPILCPS
jgi:hypothetical protein